MARKRDTQGAETPGKRAEEAPAEPREKKERVIHTRVPAVLEAELKRFAEGLRVPVSNVIRTLLEDALAAADRAGQRVEQELISAATHLDAERRKLRGKLPFRDPLDGVLGFQSLRINVDGACARCGTPIARGEDAFLGVTDNPARRVIVCAECVPSPESHVSAGPAAGKPAKPRKGE